MPSLWLILFSLCPPYSEYYSPSSLISSSLGNDFHPTSFQIYSYFFYGLIMVYGCTCVCVITHLVLSSLSTKTKSYSVAAELHSMSLQQSSGKQLLGISLFWAFVLTLFPSFWGSYFTMSGYSQHTATS